MRKNGVTKIEVLFSIFSVVDTTRIPSSKNKSKTKKNKRKRKKEKKKKKKKERDFCWWQHEERICRPPERSGVGGGPRRRVFRARA